MCHLLSIGPANCCKCNLFTHNFCGWSSSTWSCWSPSKGFDGFIKIEDKAFKSMLESSPLHGGLLRNSCYGRIFDLKFVKFRWGPLRPNGTHSFQEAIVSGDSMTVSPVNLLMFAWCITGHFVQGFYIFSHILRDLRLVALFFSHVLCKIEL